MQKKLAVFIAAAAGIIVICAALLLLTQPETVSRRDVPEFIMTENITQENAEITEFSDTSPAPELTSAAPDETISKQTTLPEETTPAQTADTTPKSSGTTDTASDTASQPSSAAAETSVYSSVPPQNTSAPEQTTLPNETISAEELSENVPDNVLVTSGDPLYYVSFEFQTDQILLSGVYAGDSISSVSVMQSKVECQDLNSTGSSFSGSMDISGLKTGYYIILVKLNSGAGMYYVFEMTGQGARRVPEDLLPAEDNFACTQVPLEIPTEGVIKHITASGDMKRAAEILERVKEISDAVCAGISNDYDKARALAVWVSRNIYYDKDAAENGVTDEEITLEFLLEYHRSVCFGWSNLYSALCQAQGIECYNASGSVVTGSRCFLQTELSDERSHSWNMVIIDGRKIWVDTVWNSSNTHFQSSYNDGSRDLQYFDISNGLLAHDHRVTRFEHRDYFGIIE